MPFTRPIMDVLSQAKAICTNYRSYVRNVSAVGGFGAAFGYVVGTEETAYLNHLIVYVAGGLVSGGAVGGLIAKAEMSHVKEAVEKADGDVSLIETYRPRRKPRKRASVPVEWRETLPKEEKIRVWARDLLKRANQVDGADGANRSLTNPPLLTRLPLPQRFRTSNGFGKGPGGV